MGTLRIRLEFDDPTLLSEAQVLEGLRQSWVQLKPEHEIIFDVASYIVHIFDLHDSCPHGILLSVDGFVLPPFESTHILNDKDVVRVERKIDTSSEIAGNLIEDEVGEKLSSPTDLLVSAGVDSEKDAGTDTCEPEANEDNQAKDGSLVGKSSDEHTILKKRKASHEHQKSKKRRKCMVPEHLGTEIQTELNESCPEEKRSEKKKKVSDRKKKSNRENTGTRKKGVERKIDTSSEIAGNLIEDEVAEKLPSSNGLLLSAGVDSEKDAGTDTCEPEVNEDNQAKDASHEHTTLKKPKASHELQKSKKKRKCMVSEHLGTEIQTEPNESRSEEKSAEKKKKLSDRKKKSNRENTGTRKKKSTKPEGGNDALVKPYDAIEEIIKKCCRTSRRKRERRIWFQELSQSTREELAAAKQKRRLRRSLGRTVPNNAVEHVEEDSEGDGEMVPVAIRPGYFRYQRQKKSQAVQLQLQQSQGETQRENGSSSRSGQEQGNDKKKGLTKAIDFNKLAPFTRLPKRGDVIAYRLLELNSTWTPELSPFRVGKTIWYNPQSHKLLLRPIRGHPIFFKKKEDENECAQRSNSLYNEDGSLVTKYSSLIDVRLVKAGESESEPAENAVSDWFSDMKVSNGGTTSTASESSMDKQARVVPPESEANPWDRNAQTASDKKTAPGGWESGAPPGNGRGNAGSHSQPSKGWSKTSASKQSGYGRGNAGPHTQPGVGWNNASGFKQSGNGRGNTGFRAQPTGGWGKPSSSTPPGIGWGNAGSGAPAAANGWGNPGSGAPPTNSWSKGSGGALAAANGWGNQGSGSAPSGKGWGKAGSGAPAAANGWGNPGSGTQPASGWSKGSGGAPAANGWGNPGSGSAPASSSAPSGNDSGDAGGGTEPSNGWGTTANDWKKANSSTQPGNAWGNAGSGTQPGNGGTREEVPSSSTQQGHVWGSSRSGTGPGNSWGKPSPSTPPVIGWGNAGSGAPAAANGWGNPDSGAPRASSWSKGSGGAPAAANGWGNRGSGSAPSGKSWGRAGSGAPAANGWGNPGSGTQPANGWSKGSGGAPAANGWGNPGSGSVPASSSAPSGNDSGDAGGGTEPSNGWGTTANDWKKANSSTPGNAWGNGGSGTQPGNGGTREEAPSPSTQQGHVWGNSGSGTGPGNSWGKPSTGGGKWSGKG